MAAVHNILLGMAGAFNLSLTISTNTPQFRLKDTLIANGWDTVRPVVVDILIPNGVIVGGADTGGISRFQPINTVQDNAWTNFLKTLQVWDATNSTSMVWNFYFPETRSYTFELCIDDYGTLYVDDVAMVSNNNWGTVTTATQFVTQGWKTIRLNATDTGGRWGAAARISQDGTPIWSTRSAVSPGGYGNNWIYKAGFEAANDGSPFPPGSRLNIVNYGTIVGHGGIGGNGQSGVVAAEVGKPGGHGLLIHGITTNISNYGTIAGGGGGGGGSGFVSIAGSGKYSGEYWPGVGGGGGRGGVLASSPGTNVSGNSNALVKATFGTSAAAGTGGTTRYYNYKGGNGGNWGAGGTAGQSTPYGGTGAAGGGSGAAVLGTNYISAWLVTGTRLGPLISI